MIDDLISGLDIDFGKGEGSCISQMTNLLNRLIALSIHATNNPKDHSAKRAIHKGVSRQKSHISYFFSHYLNKIRDDKLKTEIRKRFLKLNPNKGSKK